MIEIAAMYLDQIKNIIHGMLESEIWVAGNIYSPILVLIIFEWIIFAFVFFVKYLGNRRT